MSIYKFGGYTIQSIIALLEVSCLLSLKIVLLPSSFFFLSTQLDAWEIISYPMCLLGFFFFFFAHSFCFLCFSLDIFYWPILQFTNPLFPCVWFATDPLYSIFNFSNYFFKFRISISFFMDNSLIFPLGNTVFKIY